MREVGAEITTSHKLARVTTSQDGDEDVSMLEAEVEMSLFRIRRGRGQRLTRARQQFIMKLF